MNQNISQPTDSKKMPASLAPVSVSKGEIQGLVSWVTRDGKVSYLEASMALETAVINAAIKLGLIAEENNQLVLAGVMEQVVEHTKTHLEQTSKQVADSGFFEALPPTTNQEVFASIFGEASKLTPLTSQEKALVIANTQNKHAQIAAEIRKDLADLEAKYGKQAPEAPAKVFPTFKNLKLKNSDRAEKDGYLLYVGNRASCVRAAAQAQKGVVRQNSKDGISWKFLLKLDEVFLPGDQTAFNFKRYASQAIQSYHSKQTSLLDLIN